MNTAPSTAAETLSARYTQLHARLHRLAVSPPSRGAGERVSGSRDPRRLPAPEVVLDLIREHDDLGRAAVSGVLPDSIRRRLAPEVHERTEAALWAGRLSIGTVSMLRALLSAGVREESVRHAIATYAMDDRDGLPSDRATLLDWALTGLEQRTDAFEAGAQPADAEDTDITTETTDMRHDERSAA